MGEPQAVDLRPLRPRLASATLTLLDGVVLGGMAVLAVPDRWEWLAAAVLGLVVVLLTLRAWRIGLALDAEGLTVRNYWRTRRFRWDDIDRFETGYRVLALRAPPALAVYPKA